LLWIAARLCSSSLNHVLTQCDASQVTRLYQFFVYILASDSGTLYIGVTDDLHKRVWEHKNKIHEGFTSQREIHRLLYWEEFIDIRNAIAREKQLKGVDSQEEDCTT
jgi:putative endonuclease